MDFVYRSINEKDLITLFLLPQVLVARLMFGVCVRLERMKRVVL